MGLNGTQMGLIAKKRHLIYRPEVELGQSQSTLNKKEVENQLSKQSVNCSLTTFLLEERRLFKKW
jgi:hypothetical protein